MDFYYFSFASRLRVFLHSIQLLFREYSQMIGYIFECENPYWILFPLYAVLVVTYMGSSKLLLTAHWLWLYLPVSVNEFDLRWFVVSIPFNKIIIYLCYYFKTYSSFQDRPLWKRNYLPSVVIPRRLPPVLGLVGPMYRPNAHSIKMLPLWSQCPGA